jgi:predicted esterase
LHHPISILYQEKSNIMSKQIPASKNAFITTLPFIRSFTGKLQASPASEGAHFKNSGTVVSTCSFLSLVIAALFFVSCQKEEISSPALNSTTSDVLSASASSNSSIKVDAGSNKIVVYPSSTSTTLSGSGSGSYGAVTFQWTQVSGNSTAVIAEPASPTTSVSNLNPGIYTFTLTVTDSYGTSRVDTTAISVLKKMTWIIEGITREALVHPSSQGNSATAPVIFAFHGHGGSDLGFAEKGFELSWPEAVVVYPQGLPTTSNGDKDGKQTGWQHSVGEVNNHTLVQDQDRKFFDAMLARLENSYHANASQVFVHGWSNGGEFVYNVLWATRAYKLAALAPAAATLGTTDGKTTIPVIHIAGTQDDKVPFSKQQKSAQNVRNLNQCASTGDTWATGSNGLLGTQYASPVNTPEVFLQYEGSHSYPFNVPAMIVKFFREVAGEPAI